MSTELTMLSPAKINTLLKISREIFPHPFFPEKIFHKLESVFLQIPLFDTVRICKIEKRKIQMHFSGAYSKGIPNNSSNILFRAAELFFNEVGFSAGVEIFVEKCIPHKSGLGGASSNAATVLHILQKLFAEKAKKISAEKWNEICLKLGSDVSFFFSKCSAAKVSNFGEQIEKIPHPYPNCAMCIAMLPRIESSTELAYKDFDAFQDSAPESFQSVQNDFEVPLFFRFPDLQKLVQEFQNLGALSSGITGSGSAIYAIFKDKNAAEEAQKKLAKKCSFFEILEN